MSYKSLKRTTQDFPIYFILGTQNFKNKSKEEQIQLFLHTLEQACQAGISYFQFRDKDDSQLNIDERLNLAKKAQIICHNYHIPFIIDDNLELMLRLNADGIHIGQSDENPSKIRKAIGPNRILGVSAHTPEQVAQAIEDGANYVGCGPIFTTNSKQNVRSAIGTENFKNLQQVDLNFPVFAIGGIHSSNLHEVKTLNPDAICVISEIAESKNIPETVQLFKTKSL